MSEADTVAQPYSRRVPAMFRGGRAVRFRYRSVTRPSPVDGSRRPGVRRYGPPVRRRAIAVGASALLLALTACAEPGAPHGTATSGPPPFPRVPGTVLASSSPVRGDWRLTVRVEGLVAAYDDARSRLVAAGYRLTDDEPDADGGTGQACTTALCVSFSVLDDPELGPSVAYETFHSTGMSG